MSLLACALSSTRRFCDETTGVVPEGGGKNVPIPALPLAPSWSRGAPHLVLAGALGQEPRSIIKSLNKQAVAPF